MQRCLRDEMRGNGKGILLVEDDGHVRTFLASVLTRLDYAVFQASGVEEAVAVFERERDNVDLVFCDVVLADGMGTHLADELLSRKESLQVLLGTGYPVPGIDATDIRGRRITLLRKPYGITELLGAMREVLEEE